MTVKRYCELHPGRTPQSDGLTIVKKVRAGIVTECVFLAKDHEDEWDLDLVNEEGVEDREVYAQGQVL
jgi:hypothetical protein